MWRGKGKNSKLIELSAEDEAIRAKDDTKSGASRYGTCPLKFVRSHVGTIGGGHIMLERRSGDVISSFKGELEGEGEKVPLTKVRDLVCEEPRVLSEGCLGGDGETVGMKKSHIRLNEELCKALYIDGILAHVENAMAEGTQGAESV